MNFKKQMYSIAVIVILCISLQVQGNFLVQESKKNITGNATKDSLNLITKID